MPQGFPRLRLLESTLVLGLLPLLSSCTSTPEDASRAPAAGELAPTATFVLGTVWSPAAGWERTRNFLECIQAETGAPVKLLQRETYDEANALLASGTGDFGLICSGATVDAALHGDFVAAWRLASKEDEDKYRATVLVRADDPAQSLEELRGATFAWVDPNSLTGYHALRAELRGQGEDPGRYFGEVRFTYSHDRSIEAVLSGVVRAAVVDEVVVRQMKHGDALRSTWHSEYFPSPAFVVKKNRPDLAAALGRIADRPDCLAPLGADSLHLAHWDDYGGVARVVALSE